MEDYPIFIYPVYYEDDEKPYYIAFLPDFGQSACSATGDTPKEALEYLKYVAEEVIEYYKESGKDIPKPTKLDI